MISLKVALISAAAVGTVTAGGIAYATVGYSQSGGLAAAHGQLPSAGSVLAKPALPSRPACLPTLATPKLPAKAPAGGPTTLPTTVPTAKIPSHLPAAVPTDDLASAASCLGKKVPTGVPTGVSAPTGAPTAVSTPKVPGLSAPAIAKLDCSQVPSAVQVGSPAEQSLALPKVLRYDSARSQSHTLEGRKVCEVAQTWKDGAGQWIKLERFKGEATATLDQIRQAIQLPKAKPVNVGGMKVWQSPLGSGQGSSVIWSPEPGVALLVGASPAYQYQLQEIAARLQKIGG
jgi:hypothetical protein